MKLRKKPMSEETKEATVPPGLLLQQFLEQHKLTIQAVARAPKGGFVNPENFLPDGWRLEVQVLPSGPAA